VTTAHTLMTIYSFVIVNESLDLAVHEPISFPCFS